MINVILILKNTGYKEESRLGGKDMYSGSKAAAEILINSYFHSFSKKNKLSFCTARAGNVIGGGIGQLIA